MRPNSSGFNQQSQTGRPKSTIPINSVSSNGLQKPGKISSKDSKVKRIIAMGFAFLFVTKVRRSIKKRKHRQKVLQEWYMTEMSYNTDLSIAVNQIKAPMEQSNIVSRDESQILFPEFQSMVKLSTMMIETIKKGRETKNPSKVMIGKELNKFADAYKLYGQYFGSHGKGSKLLSDLTGKNETQMKQIQQSIQAQLIKRQSKKQSMTIKDCMEQPLYRLFKYVLLLKEYIKKLPRNHADYESVCACHNLFHNINNFNNDLMKKLQDEQKKVKLDKLFGQALRVNRVLVSQMQASTIYFNSKLYIFNDMIIITKVQSILGSQREEKYGNFELDQFGYVAIQENLKYFKNILILITKEQCIHLFFPDVGSRSEFYKCMVKIFKILRAKQHERRKIGDTHKNNKIKKITFTLQEQQESKVFLLEPEFRVEIVGFQVRPLGTLSNDTVYITRFMIPFYHQDQLNFLETQTGVDRSSKNTNQPRDSLTSNTSSQKFMNKFDSLPFGEDAEKASNENIRANSYKCINQKIEVHLSILQQIYKQMKEICNDRLPEIDPITKDVNIYSKNKRKTKSYEMRKFFIEEFFNFIFRHPVIMSNPVWFISKLRVNEDLWNYSTQRNSRIKGHTKQNQKDYGYGHCSICRKGKIGSLEQFEHYRNFYNSKGEHRVNRESEKYCFNFFNLIRMRLLSFSSLSFNTLQRILTFYHYLQGRLDYPFLMHRCNDKSVKMVKVFLPSVEQNFVSIVIDSKSTVGQVVDELGNTFKMKVCYDYDLMVMYGGKSRLLDRDEFVIDIIRSLEIDYEEISGDKKQVKTKSKPGFFDNIKKWGKQIFNENEQGNKLFFIKTTYLHRSLQLKSFSEHIQKKQIQVQKIFWGIKRGFIKISDRQFIQIGAMFYCMKELDTIQHFSYAKMSFRLIERILPDQHEHMFQYQQEYRKQIGIAIQKEKQRVLRNNKNIGYLHTRIIQMITQKIDYMTYFIQVQPREMPILTQKKQEMPESCLLGINYKNLIITKTDANTVPLVIIPLQDMDYSLSVFSIYISQQNNNYRFDSKMLYHFGELLKKYQTICKKFPQHMA